MNKKKLLVSGMKFKKQVTDLFLEWNLTGLTSLVKTDDLAKLNNANEISRVADSLWTTV